MFTVFKDWRLSGALTLTLLTTVFIFTGGTKSWAQDNHHQHSPVQQTDAGKKLGDDGFMHNWLHMYYQKYFDTVRCPCKQGECRPTTWRRDPKDIRTLQVLLNGRWVSVGEKTDVRDSRNIPEDFPMELRRYPAHACAYGPPGQEILTCTWFMDSAI